MTDLLPSCLPFAHQLQQLVSEGKVVAATGALSKSHELCDILPRSRKQMAERNVVYIYCDFTGLLAQNPQATKATSEVVGFHGHASGRTLHVESWVWRLQTFEGMR